MCTVCLEQVHPFIVFPFPSLLPPLLNSVWCVSSHCLHTHVFNIPPPWSTQVSVHCWACHRHVLKFYRTKWTLDHTEHWYHLHMLEMRCSESAQSILTGKRWEDAEDCQVSCGQVGTCRAAHLAWPPPPVCVPEGCVYPASNLTVTKIGLMGSSALNLMYRFVTYGNICSQNRGYSLK
jgi:hypothetical protein